VTEEQLPEEEKEPVQHLIVFHKVFAWTFCQWRGVHGLYHESGTARTGTRVVGSDIIAVAAAEKFRMLWAGRPLSSGRGSNFEGPSLQRFSSEDTWFQAWESSLWPSSRLNSTSGARMTPL
jgi:hypothetical protein